MKIGDLHKNRDGVEPTDAEVIAAARVSFPNADSDMAALILRARQINRYADERNEALALNCKQALALVAA
jgi:hypothetical protein